MGPTSGAALAVNRCGDNRCENDRHADAYGVNCSARNWVDDNYATPPLPDSCVVTDIDVTSRGILGLCSGTNSIFSCPEGGGLCGALLSIPLFTERDGATLNNSPAQITDLGNGLLLAIYDVTDYEGNVVSNGIMIIDSETHSVINHFSIGNVTIGSQDSTQTVTPRRLHSGILSSDGTKLFITASSFNPTTLLGESGVIIALPLIPPTTLNPASGSLDFAHLGDATVFFSNGMNPGAMARLDGNRFAIVNNPAPEGEFSVDQSGMNKVKMEIKTMGLDGVTRVVDTREMEIEAREIAGEIHSPSIFIIDDTNPDDLDIKTFELHVEGSLVDTQELAVSRDGSWAVVAGASRNSLDEMRYRIYKVNLEDGTTTPSDEYLSQGVTSVVLAEDGGDPYEIFASTNSGMAHSFDFGTMTYNRGDGFYIGREAGPSDVSFISSGDGLTLYWGVRGPCGGPSDRSGIVLVDVLGTP